MSPYHGQIAHDKVLDHLPDQQVKDVFIDFFEYTHQRYIRLRSAIIVCLVVIAVGCGAGILQGISFSNSQHQKDCWNSFNGRVTLRAIVGASLEPPSKKYVQLINANPDLKSLSKLSTQRAQYFKNQVYHLVPLPSCKGSNPNPVQSQVLTLAHASTSIKQ